MSGEHKLSHQCIAFQSQIVIVVSIKDSEASFSLTESLPSERIHAQDQTDSQQCIGSQIGEREDELCAVRYFP